MLQVVKPTSISTKTEEIKSGKNRYIISAYISLVVYFSSRSHIEAISYILWKFLFPSILLLLKRGNLVKYFESGTFVEKYILTECFSVFRASCLLNFEFLKRVN